MSNNKDKSLTTRIHPQVHFMIKSVHMFSGLDGDSASMKDIINDAVFIYTYNKLKELKFLDATATAYEKQTDEKFVHEIADLAVAFEGETPDEEPIEENELLADIKAEPSD